MNIIIIIIFFIGIFFLFLRLRKKKQEGIDKCSKCGKELGKLDINFCRYCGVKLSHAPKKAGSILKILIIIIAVILILLFFIGSFAAQTSIRRVQPPIYEPPLYEQPFEAPEKFQIERASEEVPEPYPYTAEPMPFNNPEEEFIKQRGLER